MHILEDGKVPRLESFLQGIVQVKNVGGLEVPGVGGRLREGGRERGREGGREGGRRRWWGSVAGRGVERQDGKEGGR
jgi:hypothetical protein